MKNFAIQAGAFAIGVAFFVIVFRTLPNHQWSALAIVIVLPLALARLFRPKPLSKDIQTGTNAILNAAAPLLVESREYRAASLSDVPDLDVAWYERTTGQLGRAGYVLLGDFVDVQHNSNSPGARTVVRAFRSENGSTTVGLYHLRQRTLGWFVRLLTPGRGNVKVIDIATELSGGVFVLTSTSPSNTIQHGPQIMMEHRFGATCEEVCDVHQQRVTDYRHAHPGATPVLCFTLKDVFAQANRETTTKARFHRERGRERVALDVMGSGHPLLAKEATAIKEELTRRQHASDEPNSSS